LLHRDENKKEFIRDKKRIPQEYVHYTIKQINKAEKRKNEQHNQKRKHLAAMYPEFKPEHFDDVEDYEIEWTNKYNNEKVKTQYQERKTNNGNISPPPQIIEKEYRINEYIGDKLNKEYENKKKIIITFLLLHRS
jgi:hypothetical protein